MQIIKRKINGNDYFYLEHSIKNREKVIKKQKYLGKVVPENINKIKFELWLEIFEEFYFKKFDKIKIGFSKEMNYMPKSARDKYYQQFLVKFTYESNRIEGSTLTLKETANLLEFGLTPRNKSFEDVKEAEAHKDVFNKMLNYDKDLNLNIVLYWHKLLFENTKSDIAGKIRKHGVKVARSKAEFPAPVELDLLLREFFKWYNKNKELYPVLLAALAHLKFVSIHPFSDGNGRMSRIILNFILYKNKYPMLDIPYNNRDAYYTSF